MKILQVGKYYPPYRGGMETVLENLVEGLLDTGVQVHTLVSGQDTHDRYEQISGPHTGHEGTLIRAARFGQIQSQPMNTTLVSLLRQELTSFQPDLVHLHLPNPLAALAWYILGQIFGKRRPPFVIWHHADITRQKLAGHLVRPFLGHCYRNSSGVCVSSRALAENSNLLPKYFPDVEVIPFGIEEKPWGSLTPSRDGALLFVGRLVPYKGLEVLLAAMKKTSGVLLDVVGNGPLKKELEHEVQAKGLADRVNFLGPCEPPRLAQLMAGCRALVLPSLNHSETFGLVQLEAMASGIPVIASNLKSGVSEVGVDGETCLLVAPGDVDDLASAIKRIWDDDHLTHRLGTAAKYRFTEMFTRQIMTKRVLAWYETIVQKAPAKGSS